MVRRGDVEAFSKVIKRGSYLAKERTKGKHKGVYSNNYSGSEIKPNSEKLPLVMPQFNREVLELTMCEPIITATKNRSSHWQNAPQANVIIRRSMMPN